ncbi:MAG: ester cyclase [Verrucomicrobiales bacterium]
MAISKKVLIHRWFEEVWNRKRKEAIFEIFHPQALIYGLNGSDPAPIKGAAGFVPFWEVYITAFPDLQVAVESTLAEDDKVMARCSVRGRHTGPGFGIPPTMKQVAFRGICVSSVKDGMLYEAWNSFEFLTLYQQLGLLPELPGAAN